MDLLGRPLDSYDWLTLGAGIMMLVIIMAIILFIMGLPGRIAISRNHPHAEAVKIMGWAGFLAVVPWIHAFMWAYHPSATVDIRRFPKEERDAIRRDIAKLKGEPLDPPESSEQATTDRNG
ncbi:MAG: DUF3302 domain-containing protein [Rhodobacteraceae bacterium]|nr:DUF3302 domain-containing protein [Paracoccaceae bacterium]